MSGQQADRIGVGQIEVVGDLGVEQLTLVGRQAPGQRRVVETGSLPTLSASLITYGMVAFVSAYVDVRGTAPGMFATQ